MEEFKKDERFKGFDKRDIGLFLMFEHENEATEFLSNKVNQMLLPEMLAERDSKFPYFFGFHTVNKLVPSNNLGERLFQSIAK